MNTHYPQVRSDQMSRIDVTSINLGAYIPELEDAPPSDGVDGATIELTITLAKGERASALLGMLEDHIRLTPLPAPVAFLDGSKN